MYRHVCWYLFVKPKKMTNELNPMKIDFFTPDGPGPPHYRGSKITLRHATVGRTPLDERSAHRRDLLLTTHNTHNGQRSLPPVVFEPTIPENQRQHTYALERTAIGIGYEK